MTILLLVTGMRSRAVHLPASAIPSELVEFFEVEELIPMYMSYNNVGYYPSYKGREHEIPAKAKELYPDRETWEDWLRNSGLRPPGVDPKFDEKLEQLNQGGKIAWTSLFI